MQSKIIFRLTMVVVFFAAAAQAAEACTQHTKTHAVEIVKEVYRKVLEREVDESGLITYGSKLREGYICANGLARDLGRSPEYAERFINNQTTRQAIILMYRHFLLREPESEQVINNHVNDMRSKGWRAKVDDFLNGNEAWTKVWPPLEARVAAANAPAKVYGVKSLRDRGCKFFLGRANHYLCPTPEGFNLCEKLRKENKGGMIASCRLMGTK